MNLPGITCSEADGMVLLLSQPVPNQQAQHGNDAVFEALISDTVDRAPKLNELGLMDDREHSDIPMVAASGALMRRTPANPGHLSRAATGSAPACTRSIFCWRG